MLVPDDIRALATIAGTLSIEPAESQHQLMLDGQRLDLPESYLTFLSMTRHPDQDIVLVSMNCGGTACTFLDLAFVRLYSNRPPVLETLPEFQFPPDIVERVQQGISLRDNTIDVALGLKDGVYWFASISPRDKLSMFAVSAPIEPLSDDDCKLAAEMLDYCTELKTPCAEAPFREFPLELPRRHDAALPHHQLPRQPHDRIESPRLRAGLQGGQRAQHGAVRRAQATRLEIAVRDPVQRHGVASDLITVVAKIEGRLRLVIGRLGVRTGSRNRTR